MAQMYYSDDEYSNEQGFSPEYMSEHSAPMVLGGDGQGNDAFRDESGDGFGMTQGAWSESVRKSREAKERQRLQREYEEQQANSQRVDQYLAIPRQARQQKMLAAQNNRLAFFAAFSDMTQNGGVMDQSLCSSMSATMGQEIVGGVIDAKSGDVVFYSPQYTPDGKGYVNGKDGRPAMSEAMRINPLMQAKIMQDAKLGARGEPLIKAAYALGRQKSGLTDDQLLSMGLQNPFGPYTTGGESGKMVSRLFGRTGRTNPTRGITQTSFSADGNGGFTKTFKNWGTGEEWSVGGGTRSADYQGKWTVRQSGPDGTVYDNDKTGESVTVKPGENLRDALAKPDIEKAKRSYRGYGDEEGKNARLQVQNQARENSDKAKSERQEREFKYREWAALRSEMARRRKELEGAKTGPKGLEKPRYDKDKIDGMLRDEFPTLFDSEGTPVMWDYELGASVGSDGIGANGNVGTTDAPKAEPKEEPKEEAPASSGGQTESSVGDNSEEGEFKALTRDEFKQLPKQDKQAYLEKLRKRKAKEQGKK